MFLIASPCSRRISQERRHSQIEMQSHCAINSSNRQPHRGRVKQPSYLRETIWAATLGVPTEETEWDLPRYGYGSSGNLITRTVVYDVGRLDRATADREKQEQE